MTRNQIAALVLYAIISALTFGHAWTRGTFGFENKPDSEVRLLGSFFCAFAWPLYWAAVIWEIPEKAEPRKAQQMTIEKASIVAFNSNAGPLPAPALNIHTSNDLKSSGFLVSPNVGYWSVSLKENPSPFHRFMMRLCFGFEWTGG